MKRRELSKISRGGKVTELRDRGFWFPYPSVRDYQDDLMLEVKRTIDSGDNMVFHAPTGLGKTISVLSYAIPYAISHGMKVFFLTSRISQHEIAREEVENINETLNRAVMVGDLIGKKKMCPDIGAEAISDVGAFYDYCEKSRKEHSCEYYENSVERVDGGVVHSDAVRELRNLAIQELTMSSQRLMRECKGRVVCPREVLKMFLSSAKVIVGDYFHLFQPQTRHSVLNSADVSLKNSVVIVDEAHNLPGRLTSLLSRSKRRSGFASAVQELKKYKGNYRDWEELKNNILDVEGQFQRIVSNYTLREDEHWVHKGSSDFQIDGKFIVRLVDVGKDIYDRKLEESERGARSYVLELAEFLRSWMSEDKTVDKGFFRLIKIWRDNDGTKSFRAVFKCFNPSYLIKDICEDAYASIFMSGTMEPLDYYSKLFGGGFRTEGFESSFMDDLQVLGNYDVTSRYKKREMSSHKYAEWFADLVSSTSVNTAVFFPSYSFMEMVLERENLFKLLGRDNVFVESRRVGKDVLLTEHRSKEERNEFISGFKHTHPAVLFGVSNGSYDSGIDYPGDQLERVVLAGVPYPNISGVGHFKVSYFNSNNRLGTGSMAGYKYALYYPAVKAVMQAAGRPIRSPDDVGQLVLLDRRYFQNQKVGRYVPYDPALVAKFDNIFERMESLKSNGAEE